VTEIVRVARAGKPPRVGVMPEENAELVRRALAGVAVVR
jgi:hypothetical protein